MFPSAFAFTPTEWFLPPHWSRAVVYERINHSTEDTICFSLWDREKLVCETGSKLAFAASVCERNYKENKEKETKQMVNFCIYGLMLWFAFTTVLERVCQESQDESKEEEWRGRYSSSFLSLSFILLSLSLSLSNFRTKTRSETLTRQA